MSSLTYREDEIPCYHCNERHVGCHGKCERYASFALKRQEINKEKFIEKETAFARAENVRRQAKRGGKYLRNNGF